MSLVSMNRPGFGSQGQPIRVRANAYELEITKNPQTKFYHYNIEIKDSKGREIPIALKKRVFNSIYNNYANINDGVGPTFDGDRAIFSHLELKELEGKVSCKSYKLPERDEEYSYIIEPVEKPVWSLFDLLPLISGPDHPSFKARSEDSRSSCLANSQRALQGLNVALRYLLAANCPSNSRAFFPEGAPGHELPGGVYLRSGFITRIRSGPPIPGPGPPKNLFLAMDTTCATFLDARPTNNPMNSLADLCCRILRIHPEQANHRLGSLSDLDRHKISRVLKRVKIDIRRGNEDKGITKAFGSLTANNSMDEMFDLDGTMISIQDFFQQNWSNRLRFPHLPNVVMLGGKTKTIYPMEICSVRPGQKYLLKLDGDQQSQALMFQTKKPSERFRDIQEARERLMNAQHKRLLESYGLKISSSQLSFTARVLQAPSVHYGSGSIQVRNGQWNLMSAGRTHQVKVPIPLSSWAVVLCLQSKIPEPAVNSFIEALINKLQSIGIETPQILPPINRLNGPNAVDIKEVLFNSGRAAFDRYKSKPQLLLCITEERSNLYSIIKSEGDNLSDKGVTTQCMAAKHIKTIKDQYLSNNLKIGGLNHVVPSLSQLAAKEPTMFIGADLTHNNLGSKMKPSIAALVGSMDPSLLKYSATVAAQPLLEPSDENGRPRSQEPIQSFRQMVFTLLERWSNLNKGVGYPRKIIIFRDGVSDGEFSQVLQNEFRATKMAIEKLCGDPKLCKNHRIRFEPHPDDADRSGNSQPGTIVDKVIGDPFLYDFFLQSQSGLKGTSRPTRYVVLKDETNHTVDDLQNIVNSICSGFQRATRSVGLAPPAYVFATRAKKWFFTTDSGTQTSAERQNEFESKLISHQMWWS
ncbi:ribonuclease H-like domain-containing protein [Phakopsora pachyrhizi]|nr:ribonuclease H-like domain-containing protein [Phakopsora pachyrhizi]